MKKMVRTIAAMQAAVMMLTSTAFAEELFDESMVFTEETAVMEETASMEAFAEEAFETADESSTFEFYDDALIDDLAQLEEETFEEEEIGGEGIGSEGIDAVGLENEVWDSLEDAGADLIVAFSEEEGSRLETMNTQQSSLAPEWHEIKKYYKATYDGMLDAIGAACPEAKAIVPLLKLLLGQTIFRDGPEAVNTGEIILERLDKLSEELKGVEQNLKDHTYNVVSLAFIGDKYSTVKDKAETINTHIIDIMDTSALTDEEKKVEIASIYKSAEFDSLISAMNGATDCFYSSSNSIFDKKNIFDAAYDRACEEVMFSQEALKISMPYIMSQYAIYTAAYATMCEVFDAYEEVNGAGRLTRTRELMAQRLFGKDLEGNTVGKSVTELIADYLSRDKYIFVNRSNNTNIKVDKNLLYVIEIGKILPIQIFTQAMTTPDYVKKNPLTEDHIKALANYCNSRNVCPWQFLFNEMCFDPAVLYKGKVYSPEEIRSDFLLRYYLPISPCIMNRDWACNLSADHPEEVFLAGKYTNANIECKEAYYPGAYGSGYAYYRYYINCVRITKRGVSAEKKQILKYYKPDREDVGERSDYNFNFVFFQPGN